jgi:hypothetical protein
VTTKDTKQQAGPTDIGLGLKNIPAGLVVDLLFVCLCALCVSAVKRFEVKGVALDLDGTLLDTLPDIAEAADRMLADLGRASAGPRASPVRSGSSLADQQGRVLHAAPARGNWVCAPSSTWSWAATACQAESPIRFRCCIVPSSLARGPTSCW